MKESGFIRIILLIVGVIILLMVSGIDVRETIESVDVSKQLANFQTTAINFYTGHIQEPLYRFVITPAVTLYGYIKLYIIDVLVEFIQQNTDI
ncbi:MAG: hypothetical protein WD335_02155 [Candidatus Paceibacterota bacterium]